VTDGSDCKALRAVAAELALGTLEGTERGEALAHLARCPDCGAHVQDLTEVVDQLLAVAPEAEPPAGFESAVIARIGAERGATVTHLPRRRRLALAAAAAVVLVLGGLGAGLLVGQDSGGDGPELASAPMKATGGETVGEVWRYGGDDAVLFVAVPAWSDVAFAGPQAPSYSLRLELADGRTTEVGHVTLGGGQSSWGIATDIEGADIAAVSVVDDDGQAWCTGRFPDAA
jgi:hypothetical protein